MKGQGSLKEKEPLYTFHGKHCCGSFLHYSNYVCQINATNFTLNYIWYDNLTNHPKLHHNLLQVHKHACSFMFSEDGEVKYILFILINNIIIFIIFYKYKTKLNCKIPLLLFL